jgi:hypothetical protein
MEINMLIYHPAFDPYHCVFRGMRLLDAISGLEIEIDGFRIADFYILFPALIENMRLPRDLLKWRSHFSAMKNPYHFSGDQKLVFERMREFQLMALRAMSHNRIIDETKLQKEYVIRGEKPFPEFLGKLVKKANEQESGLMNFICDLFNQIPLRGKDGLKARSGLLEYKYDSI